MHDLDTVAVPARPDGGMPPARPQAEDGVPPAQPESRSRQGRSWLRRADRDMAKARLRRRGMPIHGFVGPNGTGKSAVMVYDTLPSLEWGRPVLSTVRLLDYRNPRPCPGGVYCDDPANHERPRTVTELVPFDPADPASPKVRQTRETGETVVHACAHPLYIPFRSYTQLLDFRDGDVLMDEVTGVASSRESSGMPPQVANLLVQLRRRNVVLRWSAPAWGRADKIIRECSQAVTLTSAFLPRRVRQVEGEPPRLWRERRLFLARTFDATLFDEFDAHRADDDLPTLAWALYWGPGSSMFRAYDTYDAVTSLGWANEAGMCITCGGKRLHRKCDCSDHQAAPRPRRSAQLEGRP